MGQSTRQESRLLRMSVLLLIALVVLAFIGLVAEGIDVIGGMSEGRSAMPLTRLALLVGANFLLTTALGTIATLYTWARMSHALPELQGWHAQKPESEFREADLDGAFTFEDYLIQEDRVFQELDSYVRNAWSTQGDTRYNRYNPSSVCYPGQADRINWNRTRVCDATSPVGGVLLLHGLSDSPYSLRALGERFLAEGYTVMWLRLPGHGTTPSALAEVSWEDWTAAVKVAVGGLCRRIPSDAPLVLAGYSNGGALSIDYALDAIDDNNVSRVDALVLLSPMIGINPLARITWFYHVAGMISRSEKAKWSKIYAEIEPFKYLSWPMNANVQAWTMTKKIERKLAKYQKSGRIRELPPVFAAQSVVDSTVSVPKLITTLFDRLISDHSELFLIDVNRVDALSNLVNLSFEKTVSPKLERNDRSFRLSLLRNMNQGSDQLSLRVRDKGVWSEQPQPLTWPRGMVSLSHVAIPFPPDDGIYGESLSDDRLQLGTIQVRAEPSALMVPGSMFARSRHNPFYEFMENRIIDWLGVALPGRDVFTR